MHWKVLLAGLLSAFLLWSCSEAEPCQSWSDWSCAMTDATTCRASCTAKEWTWGLTCVDGAGGASCYCREPVGDNKSASTKPASGCAACADAFSHGSFCHPY
jgi:hypothetical protein